MFNLSPVVKNIILINSIIFIGQMLAPTRNFIYCFGDNLPYEQNLDVITGFLSMWNTRTDCFQPYQLFTYMFVHSPSSLMHLFFNMLTLVFMGPILENYW